MSISLDVIPFDRHRRAVEEIVGEAERNPSILGVLLIGSLGRGTALPGSDIDILLLIPNGNGKKRLLRNHQRHSILIEFHHRDAVSAREQMRDEPTWLYAYLDSRILYDPHGSLAELVHHAHECYAAYRSPDELRQRLRFIVDRTRDKLNAAIDADDALRAGGIASTYATAILNGLWAAYDKPTLGVSEMWTRLPDLAGLPPENEALLRALFLGDVMQRARAGVALCDHVVEKLGGPLLEPPW